MSKTKRPHIDHQVCIGVGAQVLAARLAQLPDPTTVDDAHLDTLADLSVRAALALTAAVPRAEERLAAEAAAAEAEAEAAKASEDGAAKGA